jgi:hypothetical protein
MSIFEYIILSILGAIAVMILNDEFKTGSDEVKGTVICILWLILSIMAFAFNGNLFMFNFHGITLV